MPGPVPCPGEWAFAAVGLLCCLVAASPFPPASDLPLHPGLPDPLATFEGMRVLSAHDWETVRLPELKQLFEHYMYGVMPAAPARIEATVEREDPRALGGKAGLREVTLRFGPAGTPPVHLLLLIPNDRKGPAPVFLGLNFCGNHAVLSDPHIRLPEGW